MSKLVVEFWRGSRAAYDELVAGGNISYGTRYSVKEADGTRSEYFGIHPIAVAAGEVKPVKDVVSEMPKDALVGDRYLVGDDAKGYDIVEKTADPERPISYPIGDFSVRVASNNYYRYQYVDGKLVTNDNGTDCGTY